MGLVVEFLILRYNKSIILNSYLYKFTNIWVHYDSNWTFSRLALSLMIILYRDMGKHNTDSEEKERN